MSSGTLTVNNELWVANGGTTSYGSLTINAGTVTAGSWLAVGRSGGFGVLNVAGGSLSDTSTTNHFDVGPGGGTAGFGVATLSGTSTTTTSSAAWVGETGTGVLNIMGTAGTASLTTPTTAGVVLGINSGATGVVNLLSGTIITPSVTQGNAGASGTFNFNGGTLKASAANTTLMTGLTNAYVYSSNGVIDNGGLAGITIAQALLAPPGSGVSANGLAITNGSGYIGAPVVTITGGGGTVRDGQRHGGRRRRLRHHDHQSGH